MPMASVTAKPLTGPEPMKNRIAAVIRVVMLELRIADSAFS